MTVKSFYFAPLLTLIVFALVFNSCEAPKYYENVQKDFPAVVRITTNDRMGSGVIITKGRLRADQQARDRRQQVPYGDA